MTSPELRVPKLSLVVLMGAPGAGKSAFAARHFAPEEVFALADFGDSAALLAAVGARLAAGGLAVVDAPNVRPDDRRPLAALARAHDVAAVALVLDPPRPVLEARAAARVPPDVLLGQMAELRRTRRGLPHEGFGQVEVLHTPEEAAAAQVVRVPLAVDRRDLPGPFDFIGDVHGCLPELLALLDRLGYAVAGDLSVTPPPGRTAVFLGDLVDRGPDSAGVLRVVMGMVRSGAALCVIGNHDEKLARALSGRAVKLDHGLDGTLAQLGAAGPAFQAEVLAFLASRPSHLVLDAGRVVAAHAGLPQHLHGRDSGRVRRFALYGDVSGRLDDAGRPVRGDWAADYRGSALVVYGHTPVPKPRWHSGTVNINTVNIDTGCAFGGALSALRYPEGEVVGVPARTVYAGQNKPPFHQADE